jgi:hypothetical protein
MRYQFQVDGRGAAPVRSDWSLAAQDAVAQGYATWTGSLQVSMDDQGHIERIPERIVDVTG